MYEKPSEPIGLKETLKTAGRALKISLKIKSIPSLLTCIAGFAAAFLPWLLSVSLRKLTDQAQAVYMGKLPVKQALLTLAFLLLLYLLQAAYAFAQNVFAEIDLQSTAKYIKSSLIRCAGTVEYKYIENADGFRERLLLADKMGGTHVAESLQQVFLILQNVIVFTTLIIALWQVNFRIVLLLLITCIPAVILSILQKDEEYWNKTKNMAEGAMVIHLFFTAAGETDQGRAMPEVRFSNMFPYLKDKWRVLSKDYIQKKNAVTGKHLRYNILADILRNAVYIGVLLAAARQIFNNPSAGLGVFMLVFSMTGQMQNATTKLFTGVTKFFGDIRYMQDFFSLLDTPKEKTDKKASVPEQMDILFDHVSFCYPNSETKALNNLSIAIRQGEKIAVVGENGSGKSTFVNLLCGMYEPSEGAVMVGGKSVLEQLPGVRKGISAVFQNFGHYETTIKENITLSDRERKPDEKELNRLANTIGAEEFISGLPQGFEEQVGSFSDKGKNLSGGQWQKLAIMRAAYRDQAKIMILDEPTAALDPVAEADLYEHFTQLTGDKTTILISHRLGITRVVDRVLVFDHGQIVEDGSHTELLAKNGLYAKLYQAQAQWYHTTSI